MPGVLSKSYALKLADCADTPAGAKYKMFVKKSRVDFDCPRKEREGKIIALAEEYAQNLETLALENPLQWYNFFDFFAE